MYSFVGSRAILKTIKGIKFNWVGHMLRSKPFIKEVIEINIEGRVEVTGWRATRRKQLLDDFNPLNTELNPICQ